MFWFWAHRNRRKFIVASPAQTRGVFFFFNNMCDFTVSSRGKSLDRKYPTIRYAKRRSRAVVGQAGKNYHIKRNREHCRFKVPLKKKKSAVWILCFRSPDNRPHFPGPVTQLLLGFGRSEIEFFFFFSFWCLSIGRAIHLSKSFCRHLVHYYGQEPRRFQYRAPTTAWPCSDTVGKYAVGDGQSYSEYSNASVY